MKRMKKMASLAIVFATFCLAACGSSGAGVTPPYSKLSLSCREEDVVQTYGEAENLETTEEGGNSYTYSSTYLEQEGTLGFTFTADQKLMSIYWRCTPGASDELEKLRDEILTSYKDQYGEPYFENEVGAVWDRDTYSIVVNAVSLSETLNSLTIAFQPIQNAEGGVLARENPTDSDTSQQNVQLTLSPTDLHHLGERAEGDGFALTVDSVDATPEYLDYVPADDGMTFFFISFELENTSNQPMDLGNLFSVSADGAECKLTRFMDQYNSVEWLDEYADLDGGRKIKNYISAVVPEDWGEVRLTCKDGTVFAFTRDDLGDISAGEASGDAVEVSHIGDTIVRNGMNITLTSAMQTDYVSYLSTMYYEPDPGYHFVVLFFDIQNASTQTQQFKIYSAFDLYVDDYSSNYTALSADINGVEDLSDQNYDDIAPGKSITGYKVVEVPDGWQKIELIGRQGSFEITPDEVPIQ